MKKRIYGMICVALAVALTAGCQSVEEPVSAPSAASTSDTGTSGDIPPPTTAVLAVTDEEGHIVTDASGGIVTQVVTQLPTQIKKVTDSQGHDVTEPGGAVITEIVVPPLITVDTGPSGQIVIGTVTEQRVTTKTTASVGTGGVTPPGTSTVPPGGSTSTVIKRPDTTIKTPTSTATTTKKPPTTTTTTKKPTTTTTKAPTTTTKTPGSDKDPWKYPYDIAEITIQCKKIVTDAGFIWDDSLTLENAGWDSPRYTGAYSDSKGQLSLERMMKVDELPYQIDKKITLGYSQCRIYFDPDLERKGDYYIYWLYL